MNVFINCRRVKNMLFFWPSGLFYLKALGDILAFIEPFIEIYTFLAKKWIFLVSAVNVCIIIN